MDNVEIEKNITGQLSVLNLTRGEIIYLRNRYIM